MIRAIDSNVRTHTMRTTGVGVVVAALTAIALAGCGGSSSGGNHAASAVSSPSSVSGPLSIGGAAAAVPGAAVARYGVAASDAGTKHGATQLATKQQIAPSHAFFQRSIRTKVSEESTPSTQKIIDPCSLVTRSEAESAIGSSILAPRVAPLGPTCIYESANHKAFVTVAVEVRSFAKLPAQEKSLRRFVGVGRPAYCGGTTGATGLLVQVGANEVLDVTGPCLTAGKLAAHALVRLRSTAGVPVTTP